MRTDTIDDPEYYINERMLLATILRHKEPFMAFSNMNTMPFFFREKRNRELYTEAKRIIEKVTFDQFKPTIMGMKTRHTDQFDRLLTEENGKFYLEIFKDDDFVFCNMVQHYYKDSKDLLVQDLHSQIQRKIIAGQNYDDLLEQYGQFREQKGKANVCNAEQIIQSIKTRIHKETFKTGIPSLDELVRIKESHLVVVAGESSAGKTSIAMQMMFNFMLEYAPYRCAVISIETIHDRLGDRILDHAEFKLQMNREQTMDEFGDYRDRFTVIDNLTECDDIVEVIEDMKHRNDNLKFVCIDYLQIIDYGNIMEETPRVSKVTKVIHQLAQRLNLVVILLSQLKKEEYQRDKGKHKRMTPTMQSLRGSGQIANSADIIMINYFPEVEPKKGEDSRQINIQVVKQKEGAIGGVPLMFCGKTKSFFEK